MNTFRASWLRFVISVCFTVMLEAAPIVPAAAQPLATPPPSPLMRVNEPHEWVFAFKGNNKSFPTEAPTDCLFGGTSQKKSESQQYAVANSDFTNLVEGLGLIGTSVADPLGATFSEIYNSSLNFVVWNDQFYGHPLLKSCGQSCAGSWGHSKGIVAWDENGDGIMLQVSTPAWPGSGTSSSPRTGSGNTLGCIAKPNNLIFSQHFFALKLSPSDTATILDALANASVVTEVAKSQLARLGGPAWLRARATLLGQRSTSTTILDVVLSSGVRIISKPSALHVPPWQMVSSRLGGVGLRTATWWASPRLPTTEAGRDIICWRDDLGPPGRVEVALDGEWSGKKISLIGGGNHAKLGVSIDGTHPLVIFGDLNQQGRLSGKCASSQNGRGGLFFVVEDAQLHASMTQLLSGGTAPLVIKSARKQNPIK